MSNTTFPDLFSKYYVPGTTATAELNEEDKLNFLEDAIKNLGQPGNVDLFREAMKELGRRATNSTIAFHDVLVALFNASEENDGLKISIRPFLAEWEGYKNTWCGYVNESKSFAMQTANDYQFYALLLENIGTITTTEQMLILATDLITFGNTRPVGIPIDFKDRFMELKGNVEGFKERFFGHLAQLGTELTQEAASLEELIKNLHSYLEDFHVQLQVAYHPDSVSWWGPVSAALHIPYYTGNAFIIMPTPITPIRQELDRNIAELMKLKVEQTALGVAKVQVIGLIPDFMLLSYNLGVFADTWNAFHNEALDVAAKLETLESPAGLPLLYRKRLELAISVSDALSNGLTDYVDNVGNDIVPLGGTLNNVPWGNEIPPDVQSRSLS